jgi:hypothetical protein
MFSFEKREWQAKMKLCTFFLGLPSQISMNNVAYNNRNLFSHSLKKKTKIKVSRGSCAPKGSREESCFASASF